MSGAFILRLPAETQPFPIWATLCIALEDTFKCKWTPLWRNNAYPFSAATTLVLLIHLFNFIHRLDFYPFVVTGRRAALVSAPRCRSPDSFSESTKWICWNLNEVRIPLRPTVSDRSSGPRPWREDVERGQLSPRKKKYLRRPVDENISLQHLQQFPAQLNLKEQLLS